MQEEQENEWWLEEDDGAEVHTAACPYCGDITCWCHTDVEYHEGVTEMGEASDEELAEAYAFFGLGDV